MRVRPWNEHREFPILGLREPPYCSHTHIHTYIYIYIYLNTHIVNIVSILCWRIVTQLGAHVLASGRSSIGIKSETCFPAKIPWVARNICRKPLYFLGVTKIQQYPVEFSLKRDSADSTLARYSAMVSCRSFHLSTFPLLVLRNVFLFFSLLS